MPKILFLNIYYQNFLDQHYRDNPHLLNASYEDQKASIQATMFGDSDFYSEGMKQAGWEATDIITNCESLQKKWAQEWGCPWTSLENILLSQIRFYGPDVIYTQGLWVINEHVHQVIKSYVKLITGYVGSPLESFYTDRFDIIFTGIPPYVDRFREVGVESHYLPLAFDPRALEFPIEDEFIYPLTFVGNITSGHRRRRELLERVSDHHQIDCWGMGFDDLKNKAGINYHGEAWGRDMFSILRRSYMTLNASIDFGKPWLGNMRMFEATGCGALLFNDNGDNMWQLFEPGKELIVYENAADCVNLIDEYIHKPNECLKIANAGQRKTLKKHTYTIRLEYVAEKLEEKL